MSYLLRGMGLVSIVCGVYLRFWALAAFNGLLILIVAAILTLAKEPHE